MAPPLRLFLVLFAAVLLATAAQSGAAVTPAGRRLLQGEPDPISLSVVGLPSTTQAVNVGYQTTLTFTVTNTGSQPAPVSKVIYIPAASSDGSVPAWSLSQFASAVPLTFVYQRIDFSGVRVSLVNGQLTPGASAQLQPGASAQFSLVLTAFRVSDRTLLTSSTTNNGAPGPPLRNLLPQVTAADQGVCGSGPATGSPLRCNYNNDPQGRYVCCDEEGCAGFVSPDNFVPRCASIGNLPFVPDLTQPPSPTQTPTQPQATPSPTSTPTQPQATPSPTPNPTQPQATPSPTKPANPISLSIAGAPSQARAVNVGYQTTLTFTVTNTDSQAAIVDNLISISSTSAGVSWTLSQFVSTVPFFFARNGPGSVTVSLAQFPAGASAQFFLVLTAFQVSPDSASILGGDVTILLPQVNAADQGVCGSGMATDFPLRCYYNNDPQGRYVCCDNQGCAGFNPPQNLVPHCANNGFFPTLDLTQPPTPTPTATQPRPATPSPTTPSPTPASTQPRATPSPTRPTTINFPKDTPCPFVGGFAANSCFNMAGTFHVCCVNPDSCGAFKANGDPTCAAGNYLSLP